MSLSEGKGIRVKLTTGSVRATRWLYWRLIHVVHSGTIDPDLRLAATLATVRAN